jgi:hypothetical protein
MKRGETNLGPDGRKTTAKQDRLMDRLIAELLTHPNLEDAAAAAGVSRTSAWRWMKSADFIARLRTARRDAMQHAMAQLQTAAIGAVACLVEVQSKGESESARVSAARTILEQALRAVELQDIQGRLDALEAIAKSRWKGPDPNDRQDQTAARSAGGVNGAP